MCMYCAWALAESLVGVVAGYGLYFTRTLYADNMDVTAPGWRWLVLLMAVNCALGFVSFTCSAVIVCQLLRTGGSDRAPAKAAEAAGVGAGEIALLPIGQPVDEVGDAGEPQQNATMEMGTAAAEGAPQSCRGGEPMSLRQVALAVWVVLLLFFTLGWLATQAAPPGALARAGMLELLLRASRRAFCGFFIS